MLVRAGFFVVSLFLNTPHNKKENIQNTKTLIFFFSLVFLPEASNEILVLVALNYSLCQNET